MDTRKIIVLSLVAIALIVILYLLYKKKKESEVDLTVEPVKVIQNYTGTPSKTPKTTVPPKPLKKVIAIEGNKNIYTGGGAVKPDGIAPMHMGTVVRIANKDEVLGTFVGYREFSGTEYVLFKSERTGQYQMMARYFTNYKPA